MAGATALERPLICVIDDEQWLDRASAQALTFAARRQAADPAGLVFAAREPGAELTGLPELAVEGLRERVAEGRLPYSDDGCAAARIAPSSVARSAASAAPIRWKISSACSSWSSASAVRPAA
jgi:hypothetical protein